MNNIGIKRLEEIKKLEMEEVDKVITIASIKQMKSVFRNSKTKSAFILERPQEEVNKMDINRFQAFLLIISNLANPTNHRNLATQLKLTRRNSRPNFKS